jgi:hypothetical protein
VQAPLKSLVVAALVAVALVAALARPAASTAAAPCWKTLLNDWYDGRIDHTYPIQCYRDALKHLPADVRTYSSAHDDIERALQSAIAAQHKKGHTVSPTTPVPPSGTKKHTTKTTKTDTTDGHGADTVPASPGRKPQKGLGGVADKLNPSSSTSIPVPLLVLGGLAILLLAAGAVGLVVKQVQNRRRPL